MKLKGKVAIITGAGSGIGRATALEFAREGASVVVADRNVQTGQETVEKMNKLNKTAIFVEVDVTSYESVEALVSQAVDRFGKLDIMHNNAGINMAPHSVKDTPIEDYHQTVNVNQHGVFYGIQAASNAMKENGGVIINTASIYAYIADRNRFAYHASKGAVVSMTRAAALDLARHNIRVTGIAPGLIETDIVQEWKKDPEIWAKIEKAQMRRKAGKPEDVAKLVTFLASDDASFMNAHIHYIDDGAAAFKR
ncbi:NAD(P)-dependent dehydrogenase (short-subunit alcohol dehydrogenase family) [Geomicrobium halophilum]|uniref:NAD(P)-dependent dehydrogenase (Short-subunit alcohol dehydrogenase family) n=1 Tax=Geomicrobium halophilum TaxID=549000 RepID=A0A841Q0N4_9BACL|nr:NAD(P)-dependent dehydrogenase (short-subunit alcohol dehydrogenase family) [Geomicrobium halophilum]